MSTCMLDECWIKVRGKLTACSQSLNVRL